MTRNAIIFHGTGAEPGWIWYPWLAKRLEARGYRVEVPHHPGTNVEPIDTFLPKVLRAHRFDQDTVLVGHSGGAALLLAVLERLEVTVAQAVLVAGYSTPPAADEEPVLRPAYDWDAIRAHVGDLWFLNSVSDPYGCDAGQGRAMLDRLGGTLLVRPDTGDEWLNHFVAEELDVLDRIIP